MTCSDFGIAMAIRIGALTEKSGWKVNDSAITVELSKTEKRAI